MIYLKIAQFALHNNHSLTHLLTHYFKQRDLADHKRYSKTTNSLKTSVKTNELKPVLPTCTRGEFYIRIVLSSTSWWSGGVTEESD